MRISRQRFGEKLTRKVLIDSENFSMSRNMVQEERVCISLRDDSNSNEDVSFYYHVSMSGKDFDRLVDFVHSRRKVSHGY